MIVRTSNVDHFQHVPEAVIGTLLGRLLDAGPLSARIGPHLEDMTEDEARALEVVLSVSDYTRDQLQTSIDARLDVTDVLSQSIIDRVTRGERGERARRRLALKAWLPPTAYEVVKMSAEETQFFPLPFDEIQRTISSPEYFQRVVTEYNLENPEQVCLMLFVRRLERPNAPPAMLLVEAFTENTLLKLSNYWFVPLSIVPKGSFTPLDLLRIFLIEFGLKVRVPGNLESLLIVDTLFPKTPIKPFPLTIALGQRLNERMMTTNVRPMHSGGTHVFVAYAVDYSKYLSDPRVFPR